MVISSISPTSWSSSSSRPIKFGESNALIVKQFQIPRSPVKASKNAPDGNGRIHSHHHMDLATGHGSATASQIPDSIPGASSAMIRTCLP